MPGTLHRPIQWSLKWRRNTHHVASWHPSSYKQISHWGPTKVGATVSNYAPVTKKHLDTQDYRVNSHDTPVTQPSLINSTIAMGKVHNPVDTNMKLKGGRNINISKVRGPPQGISSNYKNKQSNNQKTPELKKPWKWSKGKKYEHESPYINSIRNPNLLKEIILQKVKIDCFLCLYNIGSELTLASTEICQWTNLMTLINTGAQIAVILGDSTKFKWYPTCNLRGVVEHNVEHK